MSHKGRHYYDPIVQQSYEVSEDLSRIEVFQDPSDPTLRRWCGHLVNSDGSIGSEDVCDSDRDRVIAMSQERWPGLDVFELQEPNEDSTWDGMGPTPRLWQNSSPETGAATPPVIPPSNGPSSDTPELEAGGEEMALRWIPVTETGAYVLLDDICALLAMWAASYDEAKNPSGAMALREALDALRVVRQ